MKTFVIILIAVSIGALCFAAGESTGKRFSDVPEDHWAASAVRKLSDEGVLTGYSDSTYRGDRPVTRYELAVALARFAEFIEAGRNTLGTGNNGKVSGSIKKSDYPEWAYNSIDFLTRNLFLKENSPIIADGSKPATDEDLAQSFSSIAARIVELEVADPGPEDIP